MAPETRELDDLLHRAEAGDEQAKSDLFEVHRARLRTMVRLRLDRRLGARIDPSDVLQEVFLDFRRRLGEYLKERKVPFFLWLRSLTGQRLVDLHRLHFGAQMRSVGHEVSLYRGAMPAASSVSLANQLLGRLTSPTQAAVRAEMQLRLQEALNAMATLDREVLILRHFEELSNGEAAQVLGIEKAAASKRYVRALTRLKDILNAIPGFFD